MAKLGAYCKAFLLKDVSRFPQWPATEQQDDDAIVYVQEDYVVTAGIYQDENIVFDQVSDSWKQFCHDELKLAVRA